MKQLFSASLLFISSLVFANNKFNADVDTTKPVHIITVEKNSSPDSNILIVVNGVPAGTIRELKKDINTLFPSETIQRINVLKDKYATDKYGDKGKYGVLEFILKDVIIKDSATSQVITADGGVFEKVEVEASFAGGDQTWRRYLERNLNAAVPVDNGAPTGTYTVIVQFIVGKDGAISDIKALTNHGYGMEKEVMRIISAGPVWSPAIMNGKPVKAYRKQPVTFEVISEIDISTKIIYAGKSNPIEITVDYLKPENVDATVSYGTITHESGNKYIITVDSLGEMVLTVWDKSKKKKTEVGKEKIEVR